jgi:hypothetical protein
MIQRLVPAACLVVIFGVLPLTAQQPRVVPFHQNFSEGNGYTQFPFVYDRFRFQVLLSGSSFCQTSASLTAVAFRRDAQINEVEPGKLVPQLDVFVGHSALTPSTMSTQFATNRSGSQTAVFSGSYNLPTLLPAPPVGSGPFLIQIPFGSPFAYQLASGDLLIELVGPGSASTRDEYFIDAAVIGPEGRYTVFGQAGVFGAFEQPTLDIDTFTHPLGQLVPGGTLVTQVYGMNAAYPTVFVYGVYSTISSFGPLPFDCTAIGAPGNTFYTSLEAFSPVHVPTGFGGTYGTFQNVLIPAAPSLGGATLFHQTAHYDPTANTLGLVLSKGMAITLGGNTGTPEVNMMGGPSSNSAQGGFVVGGPSGTYAGPVTELSGTFN